MPHECGMPAQARGIGAHREMPGARADRKAARNRVPTHNPWSVSSLLCCPSLHRLIARKGTRRVSSCFLLTFRLAVERSGYTSVGGDDLAWRESGVETWTRRGSTHYGRRPTTAVCSVLRFFRIVPPRLIGCSSYLLKTPFPPRGSVHARI